MDVPLNALWETEQKPESLQNIQCISCSISIILSTQNILEQGISILASSWNSEIVGGKFGVVSAPPYQMQKRNIILNKIKASKSS